MGHDQGIKRDHGMESHQCSSIPVKMTTTDLLASASITLSITASLVYLIALPVLFQKGSNLQYELAHGMTEFKVITEGTWARIMHVRHQNVKPRPARQIGHCHCYDESKCPPGPAGPPGEPGANGDPASVMGPKGEPGPPGTNIPMPPTTIGPCRICPHGQKGESGKLGPQGPTGPKGTAGKAGPAGNAGNAGPAGPAGPGGEAGKNGKSGEKGPNGADAEGGQKGINGPPGAKGEPGPAGANGEKGGAGAPGLVGPAGPPGPAGKTGDNGTGGNPGPRGQPGGPGKDASYCPCPKHSTATTATAIVIPYAAKTKECGTNEEWGSCNNCVGTCSNPTPTCPNIIRPCPPQCVCIPGFYKNANGACVTLDQCKEDGVGKVKNAYVLRNKKI